MMKEMKRSLKELDLGLKGELTIMSDMEDLLNCLFFYTLQWKAHKKVQTYISIQGSSDMDQTM